MLVLRSERCSTLALPTEEELRVLLPGLAFLKAASELRAIQEITEEKEMYDSREKASMEYESNLIDALEESREEIREEGVAIGRIQLLQELLGAPELREAKMNRMTLDELASTMKSLQARLRERNA